MKIDQAALQELKRICADSFQRNLSDTEAQEIGQRIIRFLLNSEGRFPRPGPSL
jgi:hypothetical protein